MYPRLFLAARRVDNSRNSRRGKGTILPASPAWERAARADPTTARDRGDDIVDLQDFAGHADPRTTLGYIRNRDRLSRSPAYVLKY